MQDDSLREDQIRTLAYLKWQEAGCPEGRSEEFWLAAEQEVIDAEWQEYHRQRWEKYEEYEPIADADKALWKVVVRGIRDCINHHGPVDGQLIGSCAKRVIGGGIVEEETFRQVCDDDLYNKLIVGTVEHYYKLRLWDWQQRYKKVVMALKHHTGTRDPDKLQQKNQRLTELNNENQKLKSELKKLKEAKQKPHEARIKTLEKENLELSRQVAYWRVLAEGPPKVIEESPKVEVAAVETPPPKLMVPSMPKIKVIKHEEEDPSLKEVNGTIKFHPKYLTAKAE